MGRSTGTTILLSPKARTLSLRCLFHRLLLGLSSLAAYDLSLCAHSFVVV